VPARHYLTLPPGEKEQDYITSGCTVFDCALGGGWAARRMINIVGDNSTGKTLLAIELTANFARAFPQGAIKYAEAEEAFDHSYGRCVGLPSSRVEFLSSPHEHGVMLVEDVYKWLDEAADWCNKKKQPLLFILDSLDAVSSRQEMARDINDDSYGTERAKKVGEAVRKVNAKASKAGVTIVIISQTRAKIGVTFGATKTRSGGAALDFYASQIVWLSEIKLLKKTIRKIERPVGKVIRIRVRKNKAGLPNRELELPLIYGYGIDDMMAHAEFLDKAIGFDDPRIASLGLVKSTYKETITRLRDSPGPIRGNAKALLSEVTEEAWNEIETRFIPKRGKYE